MTRFRGSTVPCCMVVVLCVEIPLSILRLFRNRVMQVLSGHAALLSKQRLDIHGLILATRRPRLAKRPRWRASLEQKVQLGIGDVLGLGDLDPGEDKADDAEAAEDQPNLAAEIALVRVEHVRDAEREHPRHEGVDEEPQTQRLGAQRHRGDLGRDDGVRRADTEVAAAGGHDEGHADESGA
jgi:hypothetical protein